MRFLVSIVISTFLIVHGGPVGADDRTQRRLEGAVEEVDLATRSFVVEGIRVHVPRGIRGLRKLRTGEPVFVEVVPGTRPARAIRIEPVPD
ncbi:MAG: hypothetical protein VX614_05405 [Myxococcota bacterium]|nr:hypothetical protein [Myxococcota bacterium]